MFTQKEEIGTDGSKRPLANALFIQNLNPLKQRKKEEEQKKAKEQIGAMGAIVAITDDSLSNGAAKDGSSHAEGAQDGQEKLPKANTIEIPE